MPRIEDEFMRPPMMAVGDSLYQGVRSLSVKNGPLHWSAPAQVARALGIKFAFNCPDPARPMGVDMERWLTMLPDVKAIKDDYRTAMQFWLSTPQSASGRPFFENIAIASATIEDVYRDSWRAANDRIKAMRREYGRKLTTFDGPISSLMQAVNTRFTLNPMNRPDLRDMTPLGLVAARRPKRLLVNIGSNNGLWGLAFEANPRARMKLGNLKKLAQALAALPADIEHIYFNSLGAPKTVSNLMPLPDLIEQTGRPPTGGYYANYENRFGFGYGRITGQQMRRLDAHIAERNTFIQRTIRDAFDVKSRLHFVDINAMTRQYDAKHERDKPTNGVRMSDGKRFSNVMLEASPFGSGFRRGGLQSLDGMHPTLIGYGLMAQRVVDAIRRSERDVDGNDVDLEAAYAQDKLLRDMPRSWSVALWLWRDVRRARAGKSPDPSLTDPEEAATAEVMAACCRAIGN